MKITVKAKVTDDRKQTKKNKVSKLSGISAIRMYRNAIYILRRNSIKEDKTTKPEETRFGRHTQA
jgi:hypothetical protein